MEGDIKMAFQPIHFQPPPENNESIFERAAKVNKALNYPYMANEDMAQSQAKTFMDQLEAKHKEDQILADLNLKHAHALRYKQMAEKGGSEKQYAPSNFGKMRAEYVKLKAELGPDHPDVKAYENLMMKASTLEKQYAPTYLGKMETERDAAREKYGPDSQIVKDYNLRINKERSDAKTRDKALMASNLEKTMNSSDINALVRYSGPAGQLNLKLEQAQDLAGSPSKEYIEYTRAVAAAQLEAEELMQFFQGTKHHAAKKAIEKLTNPNSWGKSPQAARATLEQLRSVIRKNLETFREGQTNTEQHLGYEEGYEDAEPKSIGKKRGGIEILEIGGKKINAPKSKSSSDDPFGVF